MYVYVCVYMYMSVFVYVCMVVAEEKLNQGREEQAMCTGIAFLYHNGLHRGSDIIKVIIQEAMWMGKSTPDREKADANVPTLE